MIEAGAKANHLAYIGDARLGAGSNFGAGAIVCNYDGVAKHRTDIGKGAFIGSNAALVAPVTIGDGAYVATGSVITQDVPADALAIGRSRQVSRKTGRRACASLKAAARRRLGSGVEHGWRSRSALNCHKLTRDCDFLAGVHAAYTDAGAMIGAGRMRGTSADVRDCRHSRARAGGGADWSTRSSASNIAAMTSAGVATLEDGHLTRRRAEGKLRNLETKLRTRAAHGHDRHRAYALGDPRQAEREATPIRMPPTGWRSCTTASSRTSASCARSWKRKGAKFGTETDTEVVAHLVTAGDEERPLAGRGGGGRAAAAARRLRARLPVRGRETIC